MHTIRWFWPFSAQWSIVIYFMLFFLDIWIILLGMDMPCFNYFKTSCYGFWRIYKKLNIYFVFIIYMPHDRYVRGIESFVPARLKMKASIVCRKFFPFIPLTMWTHLIDGPCGYSIIVMSSATCDHKTFECTLSRIITWFHFQRHGWI